MPKVSWELTAGDIIRVMGLVVVMAVGYGKYTADMKTLQEQVVGLTAVLADHTRQIREMDRQLQITTVMVEMMQQNGVRIRKGPTGAGIDGLSGGSGQ